MAQYQEKRVNTRSYGKLVTRIEDLSFGLIKAAMLNYSKTGSYIETNYPLQPGKEICIGIESSPSRSFSGNYACYRARIIRKPKSLYSAFKYGYGIRYIFWHDVQNTKHQRVMARKNLRKHPRKALCLAILFLSNKQFVEGVIKNLSKDKVYKTIIPRNVRLGEAPSFGLPVIRYDASCYGAQCYNDLADEVLEANGGGAS